jgi:hypothetical protein
MVWLTKRLSKFTTFYEIEIDSILSHDYLSGLVGWERFARDNQYLQPLQGATTMTLTSHSIALSCVSRLVSSRWMLLSPSREYQWGKYHNTIDLLFDWFGISFMTTDNLCFYLQNRLIQTSQTGGQWYSDTSFFIIPWPECRGVMASFVCPGAFLMKQTKFSTWTPDRYRDDGQPTHPEKNFNRLRRKKG